MGSLIFSLTNLSTLSAYRSDPASARSNLALPRQTECPCLLPINYYALKLNQRCRRSAGQPSLISKRSASPFHGYLELTKVSTICGRLDRNAVCKSASPGASANGLGVDTSSEASGPGEVGVWGDASIRRGFSTAADGSPVPVEQGEDAEQGVDIVILTNGPGELMTWVKATVASLRRRFGNDSRVARISVLLAPCPHASGKEAEALKSFVGVDRFQEPQHFFQTVLTTQTADSWRWRRRGVSIFLGGDQFYAIFLGKRLGYRTLLYSEDRCLWPCLADRYVVREEAVRSTVLSRWRGRCVVIGDLFLSAVEQSHATLAPGTEPEVAWNDAQGGKGGPAVDAAVAARGGGVAAVHDVADGAPLIVGILPGSKAAKLRLGVPYMVGVADELLGRFPNVRFVMPLPPTVGLDELAGYGDPSRNEMIGRFNWASCRLVACDGGQRGTTTDSSGSPPHGSQTLDADNARRNPGGEEGPLLVATAGRPTAVLETARGARVLVYQTSPPYGIFRQCDLCLTTVGTNTAELGSLGVPMVVMLPTHALEVFQGAAGGVAGLLCSIPGPVGAFFTRAVNAAVLQAAGHMAWPNRWAGKEVVPELVGRLEPGEVAMTAARYLQDAALRQQMRDTLLALEGGRASRSIDESHGHVQPDVAASDLLAEEVMQLLMAKPV